MKKFISLKEEHIIVKVVSLFNQKAKVKARLLKRLLEVDSIQLDVFFRLKTLGMLTEDTLKSVSLIQSQSEKKRQREEAVSLDTKRRKIEFIQNDLLTQSRSSQVSLENKQENESQSNREKKRSRENTPIQIEPKQIKVDLPKKEVFIDLYRANLKTIKQNLSLLQQATVVNLSETYCKDFHLSTLKKVIKINLCWCKKITDAGLAHLKQVKEIWLSGTNITQQAKKKLREKGVVIK